MGNHNRNRILYCKVEELTIIEKKDPKIKGPPLGNIGNEQLPFNKAQGVATSWGDGRKTGQTI